MSAEKKFAGLDVSRVLYFESIECSWRKERDQSMILVGLRDGKTDESGHVLYCVEVDKRDIKEEKMWTDNPKLFATNPKDSGDEPQELLCLVDDSTPRQKTEEIDAIIGACRHGTQVEYTNGPDGWGLYATR